MSAVSYAEPQETTSFGSLIGTVAQRVWGEPNKRLSKPGEMRWGNQGARIVYSNTGAFKDTEADQSGGTLELLRHAYGLEKAEAVAWLVREGLIPDRARAHAIKLHPGQRIVATFLFTDATGKVLYRKHRIQPGRGDRSKEFAYDHPDGAGGWRWGRGDNQVPYRLKDLASAPKDAPIYMAEGEAKADRLASWGLIATSSKDWRGYDFSGYVKGRSVIILPDNDNTGAKLADKVKADVERAEGRPVIVHLPRLPDKGDVLNWDGDAAELTALVDAAPAATSSEIQTKPDVALLPVVDAAEFAGKTVPDREWGLEGWEPWRSMVFVTGMGATGKSLLTQQRMTCSAAGLPFLGLPVRQGVSLYITCEDPIDEMHRRQESINKALGITWQDLRGKLLLVSLKGMLNKELCTFDAEGRMSTTERWASLKATIAATGATHVTLDNVAHFFTGNENIRNQVAAFAGLVDGLAEEIDGVVILIGHPNKAGDEFSGSTAWENQVRSRIFLGLESTREGEVHDPAARVLTNSKPNYSERGKSVRFLWHNWAFVRHEDVPEDAMREHRAIAAAAYDNEVFLKCLAERDRQRRAVSDSPGPNYAPAVFEALPHSQGIGKARLKRAMERLFVARRIEKGFLWRDSGKGRDVTGIREVDLDSPNATPNGPQTHSPDSPNQSPQTPPPTHLPPIGGNGAAHEVPAPSLPNEAKR